VHHVRPSGNLMTVCDTGLSHQINFFLGKHQINLCSFFSTASYQGPRDSVTLRRVTCLGAHNPRKAAARGALHARLRSAFITPKKPVPRNTLFFRGHNISAPLPVFESSLCLSLISSASMAPVRGAKKRKRPEKPAPAPAPRLPLPPWPDGSDWWGVFYRRVAGRLSSPSPSSSPASPCSLEFNHVRLVALFVAISLITVACRKVCSNAA
jgi:hypothetical protein